MQIIWNSSTRAELLKFIEEQRASQGPDGSYDVKDSHTFVFEALSKELFVGNVYLRVYNDQPDFEISEPDVFCVALVDFISLLLHKQWNSGPDADVSGSSAVTSELQSVTISDSSSEHSASDDLSKQSDGKAIDKGEVELVKNLQSGLTSLQVHCCFFISFPAGVLLCPLLGIDSFCINGISFCFIPALAYKQSKFSFCVLFQRKVVASF